MWSRKNKNKVKAKPKSGAADTLITADTQITGDITFSGVLFVDGHVFGSIKAEQGNHSLLTVGAHGYIEGKVKVPQVVLYGSIKGDVHTSEHLNLQKDSRIKGNVYYSLLEMSMGASVNGRLIKKDTARKLLNHKPNNEQNKEPSKEPSKEPDVDELQSALDG
ncbi:MAG: polymer-forming cytoskeletal protein [Gammaproteobacteria bacterium]|nr:MAG: polymer-forming cytoskeletal protein [Gammaproteobacteria bacterium]